MQSSSTQVVDSKTASSAVPLHPLLAERWSPRSFNADHRLSEAQVTALLEAARWAPSASNTQPWRFLVAHRGTPAHAAVLNALAPGNQAWAHAASALVVVAAETYGVDGAPRPWAAYDTGQAVAHLSIQAEHEGLAVHQLGGFDPVRVANLLASPGTVAQVVLAVGARGDFGQLAEPFASRETAARDRLPVADLLITPHVPAAALAS
ncbi:nitroreductase family protein [Nocardioides sp. CN2-186]|uniref:nitroreductase family protein n=1 Tax=Nocardioides tweenelious TaxID=3156607 RepID=UPI0032B51B50